MAVEEREVLERQVMAVEDEHAVRRAAGHDRLACSLAPECDPRLSVEVQRAQEDAAGHADDVAGTGAVDQALDIVGARERRAGGLSVRDGAQSRRSESERHGGE